MPKVYSDQFSNRDNSNSDLTLWELVDSTAAVQAALELYGSSAATAAAWCALNAHFDGRKGDYRFWCEVFAELGTTHRSEPISTQN